MNFETYTFPEMAKALNLGLEEASYLIDYKGCPKIKIGEDTLFPKIAIHNWYNKLKTIVLPHLELLYLSYVENMPHEISIPGSFSNYIKNNIDNINF